MSETKQVTGVCDTVVEKGDWTRFEIDVGSEYPTRLDTKKQPLIELGRAAKGKLATWTYKEVESDTINEKSGKPFINRWLERVEVGGSVPEPEHPSPDTWSDPADASASPTPAHKPLIAGDKDRAITRMNVLGHATALIGAGGDPLAVMELAARLERWVYRDIDEVPFE